MFPEVLTPDSMSVFGIWAYWFEHCTPGQSFSQCLYPSEPFFLLVFLTEPTQLGDKPRLLWPQPETYPPSSPSVPVWTDETRGINHFPLSPIKQPLCKVCARILPSLKCSHSLNGMREKPENASVCRLTNVINAFCKGAVVQGGVT